MKKNSFHFKNLYPRQKLYGKFYYLNFFLDLFLFKLKKKDNIKNYKDQLSKNFICENFYLLNHERIGIYLVIKELISKFNKKEVIMSPYTIWDIVNMVILAGGKPVFVDLETDDLSINYDDVLKKFNINTLAILYTHYHFLSENHAKIRKFAFEKKLFFLEDCAIFLGSNYLKSNKLNSNEYRFLSFGRSKFVSTFSGGAVISNIKINSIEGDSLTDPNLSWLILYFFKTAKLQVISSLFFFRTIFFWLIKFLILINFKKYNKLFDNDPSPVKHKFLPNSYLASICNFQAKSITLKIKNIELDKKERLKKINIYYDNLIDVKGLKLLKRNALNDEVFLNFPVFLNNRDKLFLELLKKNFDCSTYFYKNCNNLNIFNEYRVELNNVEKIEKNILILPAYPGYPEENIYMICKIIKDFLK